MILSYGAWIHRFGARRNVIGQTVDLDDQAYLDYRNPAASFMFAPSGMRSSGFPSSPESSPIFAYVL